MTLWFIDAVERDARTERDAAESKLQTQETKFHDPAVLSTILVEPESCCRAEVSASRRNHAIQQGCSLNDTYGVYCISDFTAEDMKSAIIDSACDVIIVASKSGLFDSMKILLARKIISDRTEAKYKKKLQCLQIMVYYS